MKSKRKLRIEKEKRYNMRKSFYPYFIEMLKENKYNVFQDKYLEGTNCYTVNNKTFSGHLDIDYKDTPIFFGGARINHDKDKHCHIQLPLPCNETQAQYLINLMNWSVAKEGIDSYDDFNSDTWIKEYPKRIK